MTGTFVAIGGLAGSLFSRGFDDVNIPGWSYKWFPVGKGQQAAQWARSQPTPIIVAWHSAGASQDDDFAEHYGKPIDVGISVDAWIPNQEVDSRFRRVISVIAERGGRFHVNGPNVVEKRIIEGTTHTSIDDSEELRELILAEAKLLSGRETMEKFNHWTPIFMQRFMADFEADTLDAAAVFGNAGHESNGYDTLQEIKPTVPGSRGGWGIMQWTGPRRKEFEAYCERNGYDLSDMDVNYKWLFVELKHSAESRVLPLLKQADTLKEKTEVFCNVFLRPGTPHMANRHKWAERAMAAWENKKASQLPQVVRPELDDIEDYRMFFDTVLDLNTTNPDWPRELLVGLSYLLDHPPNGKTIDLLPAPAHEAGFSLPESKGNDMAVNGVKAAWQSKGIWGVLMAAWPVVNEWLGLGVGTDEVNQIIQVVGIVLAAIGRLKANKAIDRIF